MRRELKNMKHKEPITERMRATAGKARQGKIAQKSKNSQSEIK